MKSKNESYFLKKKKKILLKRLWNGQGFLEGLSLSVLQSYAVQNV